MARTPALAPLAVRAERQAPSLILPAHLLVNRNLHLKKKAYLRAQAHLHLNLQGNLVLNLNFDLGLGWNLNCKTRFC